VNRLLLPLAIAFSFVSAFFSQSGKLFTARYARLYELISLLVSKEDSLKRMPVILLGLGPFNHVFAVRPTK
jgi:hypothetical protein